MNYRLNAFGFLASKELAAAQKYGSGTLNAGLYDIQSALLWVQKHIDKFGGDPTKVFASYIVLCSADSDIQTHDFRSQVF